jgi:hypothetical protein
MMGDFSACKSTRSLIQIYTVNKPLFLDVDGEIPSTYHEFTFGVGMNFLSYPLVLTPVV